MTILPSGFWRRVAQLTHHHPSSAPYLSGDTFRSLATHVLDEDRECNPVQVRTHDSIFVASPFLDHFFLSVLPHITAPFILITHNGDRNITERDVSQLDHRIVRWYAQNCLVSHPRITPLPIGIENLRLYHHGQTHLFDRLRKQTAPTKKSAILYKFSISTNPPVRTAAQNALTAQPLAETYTDWRSPQHYLQTLQSYAFVASPAGNGVDCHRTWEALYLKTVPIVTKSPMTEFWYDQGLPIYLIDSWEDLSKVSEDVLQKTYATLEPKFDNPLLWAPYWSSHLNQTRGF